MKILRQFHPIGPRFFGGADNCLTQARLKFIRRNRRNRQDLRFQLFLQLRERGAIIIERDLGFSKILLVRERIEMLETSTLSGGFVELRGRFGKSASGM